MLSRFRQLGTFSFLICIPFAACEKEKIYDMYTGNFLFTVVRTTYDHNTGSTVTTSQFNGGITENNAAHTRDAAVIIHYGSGSLSCTISKDGSFIGGSFSDADHLHFTVKSGGLGNNVTDDVTGVRK